MFTTTFISKEFLTNVMDAKIIKITDKGQLSIPISIQEATGIQKGDEVLMVENNNTIIIKKVQTSEFKDLLKHSEKVAMKLWSSKEDDVWDTI